MKLDLKSVNLVLIFCFLSFGFASMANAEASSAPCAEIQAAIRATDRLKPGMARADVMKDFAEDGGIASPNSGRFVYRKNHYIKIDVEFEPSKDRDKFSSSDDDKIRVVSRPYLQAPFRD